MTLALAYDLLWLLPLSLMSVTFAADLIFPEEWMLPSDALFHAKSGGTAVLLITVVAVLYLLFFKHFRVKGRAILLGCLIAGVPVILFLQPAGQRMEYLWDHAWVFQTLLIVLLCFLIEILCRHYRILRIVISLAGAAALAAYLITGSRAPKLGCCAVLAWILFVLADEDQRHRKKEGDTDPKKHLCFIAPFLLIMLLPFSILPTSQAPYRWDFIRRIADTAVSGYEWIHDRFFAEKQEYADTGFIGFSGRGEFGGNLTASRDRNMMHLSSRAESDPWIYLAGKSFDCFNGRSWEKTNTEADLRPGFDAIETISAVLDHIEDEPVTDLVIRSGLNVQYTGLNSDCIFLPAKEAPGTLPVDDVRIEGGDLCFADARYCVEPYRVIYFRINRDDPHFEEMLHHGHEVTRESWNAALRECGIVGDELYSYDAYLRYRERIYAYYLPETEISPRMRSYLDEILEGADSDYEKLLRLKSIMKDFTYTDHPGELPAEIGTAAEYLDYFIFEKKEGYCSYYATAFALMARACGIPAAYVQGFHIPMGTYLQTDVPSSSAHAWVTAYLDGIGWINFEATPGMAHEISWEAQGKTEEELPEESAKPEISEGSATDGPEEIDTEEKQHFTLKWYQILVPVLCGGLFVLILIGLDATHKRNAYRKLSRKEKEIWLCRDALRILARIAGAREDGETLEEYCGRTEKDAIGEDTATFGRIYEELLYAEKEGSDEELDTLDRIHRELKSCLSRKRRERIRNLFIKNKQRSGKEESLSAGKKENRHE